MNSRTRNESCFIRHVAGGAAFSKVIRIKYDVPGIPRNSCGRYRRGVA